MGISFEGIGQWAATFACEQVEPGWVVQIADRGKVSPCGDGGKFHGVALSVSRDGSACAVALGGIVQVPYTGAVPGTGMVGLASNGLGGVRMDPMGTQRLVVDLDESGKTVSFVL